MSELHPSLNPHKHNMQCNTFTPQIKGSFCGLNVMYHNHSSPGVLQLPWCATISQWNAVQFPSGMHIIMLQLFTFVDCMVTIHVIDLWHQTTIV